MANHFAVITALGLRLNRCTAEWPCVPIGLGLSIAGMHAHPQIGARKMVTELEHSRARQVKTIRVPVKFSPTPGECWPEPVHGEHSRAIPGNGPAEIVVLLDECLMAAASAGNP